MDLLDRYLDLYVWPTDASLHVVREVQRRAEALGDAELVRRCTRAVSELTEAREAQRAWDRERPTRNRPPAAPGELKRLDAKADRCLSGVQDIAKIRLRAFGPEDPKGQQAEAFLAFFFPHGADAITSLPPARQRVAHEEMVAELVSPRWQPLLAPLGVEALVAELQRLLPEYARLVDAERPAPQITWPVVQGAVARGRGAVLEVAAWILAYDRDRADARAQLFAPLVEQEEKMAAAMKSRGQRQVPETDEVQDADEEN